ncbi:hypothetical protein AB3K78_14710 [Leucobacter sp. HNU]|uniref:hypothetical protein n=1 Tax=Leucobacter sp. HNU TaxID=3236805 RepID=UPI003A7FB9BC
MEQEEDEVRDDRGASAPEQAVADADLVALVFRGDLAFVFGLEIGIRGVRR